MQLLSGNDKDNMSNILDTFNFKDLLIKEYQNWYLLLRNDQVTIGSLVLIEKNFHKKLSDISDKSFIEFGNIVREIERTLNNLISDFFTNCLNSSGIKGLTSDESTIIISFGITSQFCMLPIKLRSLASAF